ncbi:MAG: LacI family DNA-binding transcriptional regulator [Bacillota bacterium]
MSVTIRDVASLANVSTKTVSRVINGDANVRPETRQRVQEAIRSLQYQPDPAARSLRLGVTQTIGVVIGHSADVVFSNPFFAEVLRGIGRTMAAAGYQVVLMTHSGTETHGALVNHRLVDGLILMSISANDPLIPHLQQLQIPYVVTTKHETSPFVDVDNASGAYMAVTHLIHLGHRRIGLVNGPLGLANSRERQRGYQQALEHAGIPFDPDLVVSGQFGEDSGYQLVQHFWNLPAPPTGFFVCADLTAIGVMRGIQQRGYSIPDDISVVGFDGVSLGQYLNPPLTTMNQHADRKGTVAADLLLRLIRGEEPRPRQITLPADLTLRGSTAPCRSANLEEVAR